jgi:pyruvate dehydrogenase E2 component (dihydrolipoyllysine-residue acetyltransferase)
MATEVKLPELGESVTEGTVTQWLKQVGDDVAVDEPLLEVSTDKVDTEIPSPVAGKLLEIKADQDETVEVGAVLAMIGEESEASGGDGGSETGGETDQSEGAQAESKQDEMSTPPTAGSETDEADDSEERTDASDDDQASDREERPAPKADMAPQSNEESGTEVKLPELGESVTEGTVTQWLKQVGDEVAVDESLLEVSTDKVDTEIPSPVAGTLLEIRADQDETVQVGAVLAVIGSGTTQQPSSSEAPSTSADQAPADEKAVSESDSAPPADAQADEEQPAQAEAQQPTQPKPAPQPEPAAAAEAPKPSSAPARTDDQGSAYVTPLVRKLAAQHDVDLSSISGTGVGGRIRKQDVLAAAEAQKQPEPEAPAAAAPAAATPAAAPTEAAPEPSPLRGKTEKLSRLRQVIAKRMLESLQTSAQLTTVVEVDVTAISRLRDKYKAAFLQREGVKLSYLPFFAKAAVDALKIYPTLNARIDTEKNEVTYAPSENLGIAIDTERGLLVATVRDAGDLSIAGLARKIGDLAERTRTNKITPEELAGSTFTLTNTGSRGALFDTPIIFQPQVAILGTGAVVKRPVVIDDEDLGETIAVRQMVYLALTYDHRLVDGADAARFLTAIKQRLERANFEADLT